MPKPIYVGLLGMGTVGTGVVKILQTHADDIMRKVGRPVLLKKVLVHNPAKQRSVSLDATVFTTKISEILEDSDIDIVIELIGGEHPAKEYILQALQAKKHVVTANKDLLAQYGREIFAAAEENQVDFLFEASVGGGIPIIRPLKRCLAANQISEVMGIINGTTNYMLTQMTQAGIDYQTALAMAQKKGYAEADPTADVEGIDAARKIAILASIAFGTRVTLKDVDVEGITRIVPEDIEYAKELGYVIKLLAIARERDGAVEAKVHPAFIPETHPLASVNDVFNAIFIRGDAVGETMFYGQGAGQMPTASAVVADVIDVSRDISYGACGKLLCTCFAQKPMRDPAEAEAAFYIRLRVEDKPGVLAAIAGAFGAQGVSLYSVLQKRKVEADSEIVLVTYRVKEANLSLALNTIEGMSVVNGIANVIRVEAEDID